MLKNKNYIPKKKINDKERTERVVYNIIEIIVRLYLFNY